MEGRWSIDSSSDCGIDSEHSAEDKFKAKALRSASLSSAMIDQND